MTTMHGAHILARKGIAVSRWAARLVVCCASFTVPLARAAPVPACLPPLAGTERVTAVVDNGVLRLAHGRVARLEGLLWPSAQLSPGLRQRATAALRQLVASQVIGLRALQPRLDRYRRLRVQALLPGDRWVQSLILQQGLARVSIAPDRAECAKEMYAAEARAHAARVGIWAQPAYAIRVPGSLRRADLGTFQIVEGKVLSAKVTSGRAYLDFGQNWRTDFTVTIDAEGLKRFRAANIDPYSYTGKPLRVRGYIDRRNGYEIEAMSPAQIEMLPQPP